MLELLETMPLNERNHTRALALKAQGFRLALDDHTYSSTNAAFYQLVDIVKINLIDTPNEALSEMVEKLRRYPVVLLAECVETLDVLFETSMEQILQELNMSDAVTEALLNREGELGGLLALAETLELVNFGEVQSLVEATNIPLDRLLEAQLDAYKWRSSMVAAVK